MPILYTVGTKCAYKHCSNVTITYLKSYFKTEICYSKKQCVCVKDDQVEARARPGRAPRRRKLRQDK